MNIDVTETLNCESLIKHIKQVIRNVNPLCYNKYKNKTSGFIRCSIKKLLDYYIYNGVFIAYKENIELLDKSVKVHVEIKQSFFSWDFVIDVEENIMEESELAQMIVDTLKLGLGI